MNGIGDHVETWGTLEKEILAVEILDDNWQVKILKLVSSIISR